MKTIAKVLLGALGVAAAGGVAYAVLGGGKSDSSGNGGGGGTGETPKQPETLVKYGYKVLPECGGLEVVDDALAFKHARDAVHEAPEANWETFVEDELYGPVCQVLDSAAYQKLVKEKTPFLYGMRVAVLQGAVDRGFLTEAEANLQLAQLRDAWVALGVDNAMMVPETVFGE